MNKGDNTLLFIIGGGVLLFALSRQGAGNEVMADTGLGSESYPYPGGGEGTGRNGDNAARTEPGEPGSDAPLVATIPGDLIGLIGADSWYERRNISELTGQTPDEYLAGWQEIIGEKFGGTGPGIAPENLTVEQRLAYGYSETRAQAEYQLERNEIIRKTGGSWQGGILTPPPDWEGSVTEYANFLRTQRETAEESDTPILT